MKELANEFWDKDVIDIFQSDCLFINYGRKDLYLRSYSRSTSIPTYYFHAYSSHWFASGGMHYCSKPTHETSGSNYVYLNY